MCRQQMHFDQGIIDGAFKGTFTRKIHTQIYREFRCGFYM